VLFQAFPQPVKDIFYNSIGSVIKLHASFTDKADVQPAFYLAGLPRLSPAPFSNFSEDWKRAGARGLYPGGSGKMGQKTLENKAFFDFYLTADNHVRYTVFLQG